MITGGDAFHKNLLEVESPFCKFFNSISPDMARSGKLSLTLQHLSVERNAFLCLHQAGP